MVGTADRYTPSGARWHEVRSAREQERNAQVDEMAALWHQRERIVAYLPVLERQRDETMDRLMELEKLLEDEQRAAEQIAAQIA